MTVAIIGAGITGLTLCLMLHRAGIDPSSILLIDPHFDGGDLQRSWASVRSNTPWRKTKLALQDLAPIPEPYASLPEDQTTPLCIIAQAIRATAAPILQRCQTITGTLTAASYLNNTWKLTLESEGKLQERSVQALVLAQGGEPRTLNLPLPSIPLAAALHPNLLSTQVKPGEKAVVFGTMHSGTLVMKHLHEAGLTVHALQNTKEPFVWARDGAQDGIKEEAAEIADGIVRGDQPRLTLSTIQETSTLVRAVQEADWVVYAMGFQRRKGMILSVEGVPRSIHEQDGATGQITGCPHVWGFGTAYPNRAPDGVHWDVSVAAFVSHMKAQLPSILSSISR